MATKHHADEQQMRAHIVLFLGPIRIQQDFLTLIVISRDINSDSQACSKCWSSLIEGQVAECHLHIR